MTTFADKVQKFNQMLSHNGPDLSGMDGVEVMNPFKHAHVQKYTGHFYNKFYNDRNPRIFIFGINPGRFGAGVTGIPFTDPINLERYCGIQNDLEKRHELSSQFIYEVVEAYGGLERFYSRFYFTAVSPLGFTKNGKNLNYYDDRQLQKQLTPFISQMIEKQLAFGTTSKVCICLGEGKNYKYLQKLNKEKGYFEEVIPLAHPRFILQYRRKQKEDYLSAYLDVLRRCEGYL